MVQWNSHPPGGFAPETGSSLGLIRILVRGARSRLQLVRSEQISGIRGSWIAGERATLQSLSTLQNLSASRALAPLFLGLHLQKHLPILIHMTAGCIIFA